MSDWIEWSGGECPVAAQTRVMIRLRCGEGNRGIGRDFEWRHDKGPYAYDADFDIIAYRIIKEF